MNKPLIWRTLISLLAVILIAASCGGDADTDTDGGDTDTGTDMDDDMTDMDDDMTDMDDDMTDMDDDMTDMDDDMTDMDDDMTDMDDDMTDMDGDMTDMDDDMTDMDDDMTDMDGDMDGASGDSEDVIDNTAHGDLLMEVQEDGELTCGISGTAVAFSETTPEGSYTGFDVDFCRVVAAAVLGDAEAVKFEALEAAERFTAVQTGKVHLLMRNTTFTQSRDTDLGMDFGPTTYYDGQQLMARKSDGYDSKSQVVDIDGAKVCTNAGTTTEKNIKDSAEAAEIEIDLDTYADFDKVTANFMSEVCDVITTDGSGLVGRKAKQQPEDEEWVIFPAKPISKEPLGPVYGQNDSKFADAVNWAVYATIIADEKGITQDNVDEMRNNPPDAETGRLLGGEGELQSKMGLSPDAFYHVIKQVGNYDEIFTRNLGPVGLSRDGSANAGWQDGGLIYAPPAR